MDSASIIAADNISYSYPDGHCALRNISCRFWAGEKTALLGANGAGKTTLFLHLNGLLKPAAGSLFFNGSPVSYSKAGLMALRSAVQIVFQEPENQLFSARVCEDIAFGPSNIGLSKQEVQHRVEMALKTVDIEHLRDKPTHFLSHGEKKRVAIAGALVMNPQVLIIDEPTACIDPRHQRQLLTLFDTIAATGTTVLLSTHDVELAWEWASRIVVMNKGEIVRDGDPFAVFADAALLDSTGLCRPLMLEVFETVRRQKGLAQEILPPKNKPALLELVKKIVSQ